MRNAIMAMAGGVAGTLPAREKSCFWGLTTPANSTQKGCNDMNQQEHRENNFERHQQIDGVGWILIPPKIIAATDISIGHKALLGKIIGLVNEKGYCWASNRWLGKNTGFRPGTVSDYITTLVKKGYLQREVITDENKKVLRRKLYPRY